MLEDVKRVALIGASERSFWCRSLIANLRAYGFDGEVVPVNPNRDRVFDLQAYPTVADIPEAPDFGVVIVDPRRCLDALHQLHGAGVRDVMVVSDGFKETQEPAGVKLEAELGAFAREHGIRLIGPNATGAALFNERFVAIAQAMPSGVRPGGVSVLAQSGGVLAAILLALTNDRVGVDFAVSIGNGAVFDLYQSFELALSRPATKAICAYVEGFGPDLERFEALFDSARARDIPVVMIKAGRSPLSQSVTLSHTANVAGPDAHVDAFLRHYGVLRVGDPEAMARLVQMRLLVGDLGERGIAVAGASGGGAAIAADMAEANGVHLASFGPETMEVLGRAIPASGHVGNPMDLSGQSADPSMDTAAIYRTVLEDDRVGALLYPYMVMLPDGLTQQGQSQSLLETLALESQRVGKPLIVASYVGQEVNPWIEAWCEDFPLVTVTAGVEATMVALGRLSAGRSGEDAAPETPVTPAADGTTDPAVITESVGRDLLAALGVGVVPGALCSTSEEIEAATAAVGFPLVAKAIVPGMAHKAARGGVILGLQSAADVAEAWEELRRRFPEGVECLLQEMVHGVELLVGLARDPLFGATVTVGLGSVLAETVEVHGSVLIRDDTVLDVDELLRVAGLDRLVARLPVAQRAELGRTITTLASAFVGGPLGDLAFLEINPLFLTGDGRVLAGDVLGRAQTRIL